MAAPGGARRPLPPPLLLLLLGESREGPAAGEEGRRRLGDAGPGPRRAAGCEGRRGLTFALALGRPRRRRGGRSHSRPGRSRGPWAPLPVRAWRGKRLGEGLAPRAFGVRCRARPRPLWDVCPTRSVIPARLRRRLPADGPGPGLRGGQRARGERRAGGRLRPQHCLLGLRLPGVLAWDKGRQAGPIVLAFAAWWSLQRPRQRGGPADHCRCLFAWEHGCLVHSAGAFVVRDGNGSVCLRANFSADVQVRYDTSSGPKATPQLVPCAEARPCGTACCGDAAAEDWSRQWPSAAGPTLRDAHPAGQLQLCCPVRMVQPRAVCPPSRGSCARCPRPAGLAPAGAEPASGASGAPAAASLQNVTFSLPSDAEVLRASSCGQGNGSGPSLTLAMGRGCTLTLRFARDEASYRVERLLFTYNLSDAGSFPNASGSGAWTAEADPAIRASVDTRYRCSSRRHVRLGAAAHVTLSNATLQAYLFGGDFSRGETRCEQDGPGPSPSPSPAPAPEPPSVGKYNVSGANGTCLLASVGLQLHVTFPLRDNKTVTHVFSVDPNKTAVSGSCAPQLATLELRVESLGLLVLQFAVNTSSSRFFLQEVRVNLTLPSARDPAFVAANGSLRALGAALGHSYRCSAEQQVRISKACSLGVVKAWLQAFQIQGDTFGAAEECPLDQNSMLIPMAVGGALAGLVLVVLIAYLIGRKRSHAGYQTI
ncbi:Lysosome-associated membrane glycoprotein 1 [Galemys pyrenaicus]|uniref:Lysosome-associated membrane glycoprotein 1 n=1 Tax=Galemys pyrenaicus TaxID=202257 RepID=A0A8J6AGX2_GALPY|nr:Lysosome-associated membrane glycoprotein 1 [Galemys pyrenaicus]